MPSDDITKTSNINKASEKAYAKSKKSMEDLVSSQQKMGEFMEANIRGQEQMNRTAEKQKELQEGILAAIVAQGKAITNATKNFFDFSNQINAAGGAISGYINRLQSMSSITSVYSRKLEALQKGQLAFTSSIQATTANIASASQMSQKYVSALHDSFAAGHKIAGEFAIEYNEVKRVTEAVSGAFSSQLIAMGNIEGSLNRLTKEAIVMSRYFGTEAKDVINTWAERMAHSNMTLQQSQNEFMRVSREVDIYTQAIAGLGTEMQKTAMIGKKEFLDMVMAVGKQLRTGIFDAEAYAKALRGVLVSGEKLKYTKQEQITQADVLANIFKDMQAFRGELTAFGHIAAQRVLERIKKEGTDFIKDKEVKARVEMAIKRSGPSGIIPIRELMGAMRGSAQFQAEALNVMRSLNPEALKAVLSEQYTGGNVFLAANIAQAISSGKIQETLLSAGTSEGAETPDKRNKRMAEVFRSSVSDLVKAGATPTELDYKLVKLTEEIKNYLAYIVKYFPYLTMGAQMGGSLLQALFRGGGGGGLLSRIAGLFSRGGGGGLLSRGGGLLSRGASPVAGFLGAPIGSLSTLGAVGGGFAVAGAGLLGWKAGRALDKYGGRFIYNNLLSKEHQIELGADTSLSGMLSLTPFMAARLAASRGGLSVTRMDEETYQKKKKEIEMLDKVIKRYEIHSGLLTEEARQELELMKSRKKTLEVETERRRRLEEEAKKATEKEYDKKPIIATMEALNTFTKDMGDQEKAKVIFEKAFTAHATTNPEKFLKAIKATLTDETKLEMAGISKEKLGDVSHILQFIRQQLLRKTLLSAGGLNYTESQKEWHENLVKLGFDPDKLSKMTDAQVEYFAASAGIKLPFTSINAAGSKAFAEAANSPKRLEISISGDEQEAKVEENARGQITLKRTQNITFSSKDIATSLYNTLQGMMPFAGGE